MNILSKIEKVEQMAKFRWYVYFKGTNRKGETMLVELSESALGNWFITTYITDTDGHCWGKYDPTIYKYFEKHKNEVTRSGMRIYPEWQLEATHKNAEKLLNACYWNFKHCKKYETIIKNA